MVLADKIIVKTKQEAFGIPTTEANCAAVRDVRYVLERFPAIDPLTNESIADEVDLLTSEVDYAMDTIFNMSGDVFWESVFQAVRCGYIDVPFAPHKLNANKLLTLRDRHQAIRVKSPGNLPIRPQDLKREQKKLRGASDRNSSFVEKMIQDIQIMS